MALSDDDKRTLEEIVKLNGACLDSKRCSKCPFRVNCLPEFLNPNPPSQDQRLRMALNILTHHMLLDEEMTSKDTEEYEWTK